MRALGRTRKALLIGVDRCADSRNLPPLRGPQYDITALREALVDANTGLFEADDVKALLNPSKKDADDAISEFFGGAARDDILLFYYSGHGKLTPQNKFYLCTIDSIAEKTKLHNTSISTTGIRDLMDGSEARTFVVVLDCCHSGAFRGEPVPAELMNGNGLFFMSSCRARQLASDGDGTGPSPFTGAVAHALRNEASDADRDGLITFDDVYQAAYGALAPKAQYPQRSTGEGSVALARTSHLQREDRPVAGAAHARVTELLASPAREAVAAAAGTQRAAPNGKLVTTRPDATPQTTSCEGAPATMRWRLPSSWKRLGLLVVAVGIIGASIFVYEHLTEAEQVAPEFGWGSVGVAVEGTSRFQETRGSCPAPCLNGVSESLGVMVSDRNWTGHRTVRLTLSKWPLTSADFSVPNLPTDVDMTFRVSLVSGSNNPVFRIRLRDAKGNVASYRCVYPSGERSADYTLSIFEYSSQMELDTSRIEEIVLEAGDDVGSPPDERGRLIFSLEGIARGEDSSVRLCKLE